MLLSFSKFIASSYRSYYNQNHEIYLLSPSSSIMKSFFKYREIGRISMDGLGSSSLVAYQEGIHFFVYGSQGSMIEIKIFDKN